MVRIILHWSATLYYIILCHIILYCNLRSSENTVTDILAIFMPNLWIKLLQLFTDSVYLGWVQL